MGFHVICDGKPCLRQCVVLREFDGTRVGLTAWAMYA